MSIMEKTKRTVQFKLRNPKKIQATMDLYSNQTTKDDNPIKRCKALQTLVKKFIKEKLSIVKEELNQIKIKKCLR